MNSMPIRKSILVTILWAVLVAPVAADDHLTGEVIALDREKSTVIIRPSEKTDIARDITVHLDTLPYSLKTGELVGLSGKFRLSDHTLFDARRIEIRQIDPTGVRARLRSLPPTGHTTPPPPPHPIIPKTFQIPLGKR
jgi:hypothetical protein